MPGELLEGEFYRMNKEEKVPSFQSPYEKFIAFGPESLSDAELLAIIIRTGTKYENSTELGHKVLQLNKGRSKGISGLYHVALNDLMSIKGIGQVKAVKIKCVTEFSKRIAKEQMEPGVCFLSPDSVAQYYMERLRHLETEQVFMVMTDNKNYFINEVLISKGTVNSSMVSTREIFLQALRFQAVHILLLHNHPSGDPEPSKQDIAITKTIKEASELLQIPLVDHIIIGDNSYRSFKEIGLL